jgi:hypothetical protein
VAAPIASVPVWVDVVEPIAALLGWFADVEAPVGNDTVPVMFVMFHGPDCVAATVPLTVVVPEIDHVPLCVTAIVVLPISVRRLPEISSEKGLVVPVEYPGALVVTAPCISGPDWPKVAEPCPCIVIPSVVIFPVPLSGIPPVIWTIGSLT